MSSKNRGKNKYKNNTTIYQNISYKELVAIKNKLKGSKIIQVYNSGGYRYALFDKKGNQLDIKEN